MTDYTDKHEISESLLRSSRKISFSNEGCWLSLSLSLCHATLTLENVSTLFVPAIRIVESVVEQRDDCKHTVCLRCSTVETSRNKSSRCRSPCSSSLCFLTRITSRRQWYLMVFRDAKKNRKKRKSLRKNHGQKRFFFPRRGWKRREWSYHLSIRIYN